MIWLAVISPSMHQSSHMYKLAAIITPLQEHQQRALKKALKNNVVLAHSTGSGKTLAAIAIADALGLPTTVFTPAPLVENFKKELEKHKVGGPSVEVLSVPTAVSRNIPVKKGNTVIIDEAHMLRNASQRQQYLKQIADKAGRVVALTGTPAYNAVEDWTPLISTIAGAHSMPDIKNFIKTKTIYPGFFARLRGVKPGSVEVLTNKEKLSRLYAPYVDVFDADIEKPERIEESIEVPMSPEQKRIYQFVTGKIPWHLRYKIENNLPPSKAESSMLNAFLTGVRQVSNTTQPFVDKELSIEALEKDSPKLKRAADDLRSLFDKNKNARAFVYSNFLGAGVEPFGRMLTKRGIKYNLFNGGLSPKARKEIVRQYNEGEVPVILGTGAASEGLDLKKTSLIQILEPHWNNARIEQAIGRGIRYKSHEELPPEERKVKVNRYYAALPEEEPTFWERIFGRSTPATSVDNYLKSRAEEKDRLIREVKEALENKQ